MSIPYEALAKDGLETLGLETALAQLDQASQRAAAEKWSYSHFLGYLFEGELQERHNKKVRMSMQFSKFPCVKRMEDFNFEAQPTIDRRLMDELGTARFLDEGRNIIFLGPPGVGKTHLAISLGVMTAELGKRVYFTSAIDMARKLAKTLAENRLDRELKNMVRPSLLIIDEVGYLELDKVQASLLFQVISQRYDKQQATIITSNKPFSEWGHVFANDPIMASAALDRLLHLSTVINIRGESYRLNEKRSAGMKVDPSDKNRHKTTKGEKTA